MQKYVYDFTKFLNREELIEELKNINYVNPKKEEILENYNFDTENIDIDDIETTIKVNNFKKDLKSILSLFDFSILSADPSGQDYENNKGKLFNLLKWNGIDIENDNLDELANTIKTIKEDISFIEDLNKTKINIKSLNKIFKKYNLSVSEVTLNNITSLINNMANQQAVYLPIIRSKYYDEGDKIFYTMSVDIPEDNPTNLRKFSGEIYEKLDFKNDIEAKEYQLKYNISEPLDSEITTYIHFEGEEINDNWSKKMHIIKQRNTTVIMYGEPFILTNENNKSITEEEIVKIITELKNKTPNNEFLKYVIRELKSLKKVLGQRSYIKKNESIDKDSLYKISSIICDKEYGDDRNIYFKSKIISSTPLKIKENKILTLNK